MAESFPAASGGNGDAVCQGQEAAQGNFHWRLQLLNSSST